MGCRSEAAAQVEGPVKQKDIKQEAPRVLSGGGGVCVAGRHLGRARLQGRAMGRHKKPGPDASLQGVGSWRLVVKWPNQSLEEPWTVVWKQTVVWGEPGAWRRWSPEAVAALGGEKMVVGARVGALAEV